MHSYNTVTEAIADLIAREYTRDVNILPDADCLVCNKTGSTLTSDDFVIDEVFRFEGMTDPADEMILYAISSDRLRIKGLLLNGYGMYAEPAIERIVKKLSTHHSSFPYSKAMKKYCLFLPLLMLHIAAIACPACEKQQPKILRGITHGTGPDSQWDYVIVWAAVILVLLTLFYSIKWLIRPGEHAEGHIKQFILND